MREKRKPFTFRGKILLPVVIICYVVLFLADSEKGVAALQAGGAVLAKIIPIFVMVILFTALLNFLIKPKQVRSHLGQDSGMKGLLWALAAGVISHGPMYAWYPLLDDLRSHGMRNGLLIIFFAARAIKIPLLPMMIDYFGIAFTLALSFYIMTGALVQGWLYNILEHRKRL